VAYFLQVEVVDRLDHLQKNLPRDFFIKTAALIDAIEEFTSLAQAK